MLELALVIDVTSNVIKNSLCHTRIGEDRKAILEKQGVSNKQHRLSIPAPYRKVSGFHALNSDPIVHVPAIGRLVPQVIITILKNGLRKDRSNGNGRDHGGGRRRHGNQSKSWVVSGWMSGEEK